MFHTCILRSVLISTKDNSLVGMNRAVTMKPYGFWVYSLGSCHRMLTFLPLTCLKALKKAVQGHTVNQHSSGTDAIKLYERRVWLVEPSNYMDVYSLLAQMGFCFTVFQFVFFFFCGGRRGVGWGKCSKINPKGNCM